MKLSTIVVGVDEHEPSIAALKQAIALAKRHRAQLILVHGNAVTDTTLYAQEEGGDGDAPWKTYLDQQLQHAEDMLERHAQRCREQDIRVTCRLERRFPDAAIAAVAKETEADLVVVGTHARRGPEHWLLGSVAEQVVRIAPAPVLVARQGTKPKAAPGKIVVTTDFSATANLALAAALELAEPNTLVDVLHCWQPPLAYGMPIPDELCAEALERARQQMNDIAARFDPERKRLTLHVLSVQTVSGIAEWVSAQQPDWLVIGSHGRRGLRRMVLGSVTEQVIRRVNCSTLVVRGADPGWSLLLPVI